MSLDRYILPQVEVRLKLKESEVLYSPSPITSPDAAVRVMAAALRDMDREMVCVVNLDNHKRPINFNVVSIGGLTEAILPIQNVFKASILSNADSFLLLHTHPSGIARPSLEDDTVTRRMVQAGNLMGIPLTDHIIIGSITGDIYSYHTERPEFFTAPAFSAAESKGGRIHMNEITFDSFKEKLEASVREELNRQGITADVQFPHVSKLDRSYDGITIIPGNEKAGPVFDLEGIYRSYLESGQLPVESMIDLAKNGRHLGQVSEKLENYENIKDSLMLRLSPLEGKREFLDTVVHREFLDLAVTIHIVIGDMEDGMSTIFSKNMLERYGITADQLFSDAVSSSMKLAPAKTMGMMEAISGVFGMDASLSEPSGPETLVITTDSGIHGAAAILYPHVLEQAAERLGENFFILPSSRHEVILMPESMAPPSVRVLESLVKEVNETQVAPEDRLSDKVYHYDDRSQKLELGSDYEAHKNRIKQKQHQRAEVAL